MLKLKIAYIIFTCVYSHTWLSRRPLLQPFPLSEPLELPVVCMQHSFVLPILVKALVGKYN